MLLNSNDQQTPTTVAVPKHYHDNKNVCANFMSIVVKPENPHKKYLNLNYPCAQIKNEQNIYFDCCEIL